MSNKHTHSDAAWNIAYEIHSKDAHQWDRAKMNYYRNCERNGAPYPWLTEELDVIENTLLYLGLQDQPDPKKWVETVNSGAQLLPFLNDMLKHFEMVATENRPYTWNVSINLKDTKFDLISLWASPSNVCDSPIKRVQELAKEKAELQAENERLKEALAKIYTCDVTAKDHIGIISQLRGIAEQAHPDLNKEEEQEPPTWEAREAWEGGFADNH